MLVLLGSLLWAWTGSCSCLWPGWLMPCVSVSLCWAAAANFFSGSCVPCADQSSFPKLCQLCAGKGTDKCACSNHEPYFGYSGAFKWVRLAASPSRLLSVQCLQVGGLPWPVAPACKGASRVSNPPPRNSVTQLGLSRPGQGTLSSCDIDKEAPSWDPFCLPRVFSLH